MRTTARKQRRRTSHEAQDRAWHEARMAEGMLGPQGFVSWEIMQYEATARMSDPGVMGGHAPDHKAIRRKAWRLYHKLKP
jgi:hypothetical protein